jgi:translation initiation factor 2 gamma subunit (eIF-2gamma)
MSEPQTEEVSSNNIATETSAEEAAAHDKFLSQSFLKEIWAFQKPDMIEMRAISKANVDYIVELLTKGPPKKKESELNKEEKKLTERCFLN